MTDVTACERLPLAFCGSSAIAHTSGHRAYISIEYQSCPRSHTSTAIPQLDSRIQDALHGARDDLVHTEVL